MNIRLKIPQSLLQTVRADLVRRHPFAAERVGFVSFAVGPMEGGIVLMAHQYLPVEDEDYVDDPRYGAYIGRGALRKALQLAYNNKASMFHVHMHEHVGMPRFSRVDLREYPKFVPDFWKVQPALPHGALLLSDDGAASLVWYPGAKLPLVPQEIWEVGATTQRL